MQTAKGTENITPMLDVVFILLIFFIVTAQFIKEPGVAIIRPDVDNKADAKPLAILICSVPFWIGNIDVSSVGPPPMS